MYGLDTRAEAQASSYYGGIADVTHFSGVVDRSPQVPMYSVLESGTYREFLSFLPHLRLGVSSSDQVCRVNLIQISPLPASHHLAILDRSIVPILILPINPFHLNCRHRQIFPPYLPMVRYTTLHPRWPESRTMHLQPTALQAGHVCSPSRPGYKQTCCRI
jgi:hypothetical protein